MGTKEFQCGGHESALLDCSSASERNTCSPGTAVSLTCSEPDEVRLVGGESRCAGDLELKHQGGEWRPVGGLYSLWTLKAAGVLCRDLDCGSAVSVEERESSWRSVWRISSACVQSGSALRECAGSASSSSTVNLTCSEPDEVRLEGGESRCAGDLELKHQGEWRPVGGSNSLWTLKTAGVACRELDCGSAVSVGQRIESPGRSVWGISFDCVQSGSALRECAGSGSSDDILNLTCSDLLFQPNISVSSSTYGVSGVQQQGFQVFRGSTFTISCSIQPQYPGGSFQLNFTSINSANKYYSEPAVNHSAHFLFPSAEPAHQGSYSCVYHLFVFSHNFSSESRLLSVSVTDPGPFIIRAVVLLLTLLLVTVGLYFYCKATRGRRPSRLEDIELDYEDIEPVYDNLDIPAEEEGAPGAE
ncbi:scavenger receptor cysteine-rich type 1 protein M130-like [Trematomus bernacchii]|uniref:scavenger receptor cysteine-rich type 1 protein M130-like n=1 Tax=Trematomus bernacchii TaxID=40690 RepID=UPI00146E4EC2|nr:scavenger receptor cysteine-rich type 1 protein M130-like [Trematomus bernacchii]